MHVLHLVAVEADTEEEAIIEAEQALEPYGQGQVWDWYEVGGRWSGFFSGSNALRYTDDPEAFQKSIARVRDSQNRVFCETMDKILGRAQEAQDVADYVLGVIPVGDKVAAARHTTDENRKWGEQWERLAKQQILPSNDPTFERLDAVWAGSMGTEMLGYYLCKLGNALGGNYTFESYYYDGDWGGTSPTPALERCAGDNPERQWLVAVDLHN